VYRKEWLPAMSGQEPEPLPAPTTRSTPPATIGKQEELAAQHPTE
jgi:hypothetical protein